MPITSVSAPIEYLNFLKNKSISPSKAFQSGIEIFMHGKIKDFESVNTNTQEHSNLIKDLSETLEARKLYINKITHENEVLKIKVMELQKENIRLQDLSGKFDEDRFKALTTPV